MKEVLPPSFLVLALIVVGAGAAGAMPPEEFGTPDGMPPPLEDICDMTSGAAHGLCIAFCEAMDCDSEDPQANENACTRVGDKYMQVTGELPPCVRVCPCWEASALESVTAANQLPFNSCPGFAVPDLIQNDGSTPGVEGGFAADPTGALSGSPACFTRDLPPFALFITLEEAEVCADQIRDRCAAIGTPIP